MTTYLKLNNEVLNTYSNTGIIDKEKDKLSTKQYFLENVNTKVRHFLDLEEKLKYLISNKYYEEDFLKQYNFKFIKKLFKLAYGEKFRFESFMSASKFYKSYALKSKDDLEILEKYEDRIVITSLYLSDGDEKLAENSVKYIMKAFQPATPTYLNSGKEARGELVSCYKISPDDSMSSISENIGYALELSRLGGGVGVNLSDLREMGAPIKGILNRASGVMPVCKLLENSFSYANQQGARDGSGVVNLNIFHGDIEQFISAKKPNADEKIRLQTLSTSVVIPDIFFELMRKNKDIILFSPYDIYKEYGLRMSDFNITENYYELLDNPNIRKLKRINARKLYTEIKKSQFESGYPFEIFSDTINNEHLLSNLGKVKQSNLCTEVLQVQTTSEIKDKNKENNYGLDVSCNLGSIDIHEATKVESFEELIDTSVRLLTSVSDKTNIVNVPSIANANENLHSIGLGVMNLHGHLISEGIDYESEDAKEFIDKFMESMRYYTLKSSCKIAKEKGIIFYGFENSDYNNGKFFSKYTEYESYEASNKVKLSLGKVPIINKKMWEDLQKEVEKYGLYNAYQLCIAPTGSISYIRNCTASIAPITEHVEIRDYGDSRTIYPMPFITTENKNKVKDAYEINQFKLVELYASAQKWIDQGISMTLYITDKWTTEDLAKLYIYAHSKGIKTVYYVRQRMQTLEECVSCSI